MTWRHAFVIVLLSGCAVLTHQRTTVWRSERSLWEDAVLKAPTKPRPVMNLGRAHDLAGDRELARMYYKDAVFASFDTRRPLYVRRYVRAAAETNLAHLLMSSGGEGDLMAATAMLEQVIAAYPAFPFSHYNMAAILQAAGQCVAARNEIAVARRMDASLTMRGRCFDHD